jgi:hypothetical protein
MAKTKQTARKTVGNKPIRKLNNLDIIIPKKRGRPKGSKNKSKVLNIIISKKRGRPKGSKNKPKELNGIVKKGPERPPTELNGIVKRGPGRPRKELEKSKKISIINSIKLFNNNANKNICNEIFSSGIKKIDNKNDFFVGVLDSVEHNTSNSLMKHGIKKEQIFLVENNIDVYNSHIQHDFKTYKGSLDEFVESNIKFNKYCLGWYFDTCGCIRTQEPGILNIIRDLNLINGSILGFTFSKRDNAGNKHQNQLDKFILKLEINFEIIYELEYSGNKFGEYQKNASNMHTLIIKVIM